MWRARVIVVGAALVAALAACAGLRAGPPLPPAPVIDPAPIARDVAWLADDARGGRGPDTPGLAAAADYLARGFREAGFAPGGDGDSYLQRFDMPVSIGVGRARLRVDGVALERGSDFDAFLSSDDGSAEGAVVFAGYGISSAEHGYDDYTGVDVQGRVVLILDDRPGGSATPLAGREGVGFLRRGFKVANAARHGAAAVLLAPSTADAAGLPGEAGQERASPALQPGAIPIVAVSRATAERIVASAGGPGLAERQAAIAGSGRPASELLAESWVEVDVAITRRSGSAANVIAVRAGSDPAVGGEVVLVGAHYDHLGQGDFGSLAPSRRGEVHNGADDNASGTAGLLALARAFAAEPPTRRTLVLAGFAGEEVGLLGSRHYVNAPSLPLDDTVAMVNLDMIGRMRDRRLTVFGAETSPGFPSLVRRAADGLPVDVSLADGAFAPSDQTSFFTRGVPVLFFFTGTHREYHTPDDDASLVDAPREAEVLQVVYRATRALLDAPERPAVVEVAGALPEKGDRRSYGPYLGTVPDFAGGAGRGVALQGVRPGSPAERAGLRADDRIVEFDGAPVSNLEEFAALLFGARPGQEVDVVVMRGDERVATRVTLGQRR